MARVCLWLSVALTLEDCCSCSFSLSLALSLCLVLSALYLPAKARTFVLIPGEAMGDALD